MNARRSFDRLTFLTALTAIAAYCVAEGNAPMAVVALPSAVLAWWLRGRAFAADIPRVALNLVLVAVVAYAILTVLDEPSVTVDDIARLILILLIVKLFDRTTARDAAQALSLSLFLAIAAILNSVKFELGLLLVPLVPMLIAATMQYQVHAGHEALAASLRLSGPPGEPPPVPRFVSGPGQRRHIRRLAVVSAAAIVACAAGVFIMVPRGMNAGFMSRWGAPSAALQTRFTSTVQLGRGGFLSESQRVVMQVSITEEDGTPLGGADIVYRLRGNILDEYDPTTFGWRRREPAPGRGEARRDVSVSLGAGEPFPLGNADGRMIFQHVTLLDSSQGQRFLFAMQRPVLFTADSRAVRFAFNNFDRRIILTNEQGELRYTVASIDPESPVPFTPWRTTERPTERASFDSEPIAALASEVLSQAGIDPAWENRDFSADSRACRAIQSFLREGYAYTTDIQAAPPGKDPIEWFLLEHKEGHCEYFASAMAAMCRAVGIPSRVIAGYVAAEWNETSGAYIVRESNAHAWIEAEIAHNEWRTFDPTPSADLLRLHRPEGGLITRLRHMLDAMEHAWINSIVTYDQGSRRRLFKDGVRGADDWFSRLTQMTERVRLGGAGLFLRAVLAGVVVFAAVAVGGRLVAIVIARRERARAGQAGEADAPWRIQTGFYPRMLDLLRKRGVPKPAWSPPLRHAGVIADTDGPASAAAMRLAGLYYEARFAGRRLTDTDLAEAEQALATLESQPPASVP